MIDVYELIETISQRTAMYTGECKLSNVRSFIDGYTFALSNAEQERFLGDFAGFHDWVAAKFGFYESTAGWQNMILAVEMGLPPRGISWRDFALATSEAQHESRHQFLSASAGVQNA